MATIEGGGCPANGLRQLERGRIRPAIKWLHREGRRQRVLQDVLVRQALIVNAITSAHDSLLVTVDVPGDANPRREVIVVAAADQRAVANSWCSLEAGQIHILGNQERIFAGRRECGIKDARTVKFVTTKTHRFPAKPEIDGDVRFPAIVILDERGVVSRDEVSRRIAKG